MKNRTLFLLVVGVCIAFAPQAAAEEAPEDPSTDMDSCVKVYTDPPDVVINPGYCIQVILSLIP